MPFISAVSRSVRPAGKTQVLPELVNSITPPGDSASVSVCGLTLSPPKLSWTILCLSMPNDSRIPFTWSMNASGPHRKNVSLPISPRCLRMNSRLMWPVHPFQPLSGLVRMISC